MLGYLREEMFNR